jgi:hypothetical protein
MQPFLKKCLAKGWKQFKLVFSFSISIQKFKKKGFFPTQTSHRIKMPALNI